MKFTVTLSEGAVIMEISEKELIMHLSDGPTIALDWPDVITVLVQECRRQRNADLGIS